MQLNKHVANMAQAYEITEIVSLQIVLVFALNITKISEWLNVMHIKFFTEFDFSFSAFLASVIVALTCCPALTVPVGAIVQNRATFPEWICRSDKGFRAPKAITLGRTKVTTFVHSCGIRKKFGFTIETCYGHFLVMWAIFAGCVCRLPFAPTGLVAKVILSLANKAFFTRKNRATMRAWNLDAIEVNAIRSGVNLLVCLAGAVKAAVVVFVFFNLTWLSEKCSAAFSANQVDFWGSTHKKYLLLVVDRVLVEGIRTLTEGIVTITGFMLSVNKYMPSTGVIVPQNGSIV